MNFLVIVLRILHIISGIIWVGAALMLFFFIGPTVEATQESGQKFIQHLMTKTRFGPVILISALLALLAGFTLYWIDSDGFSSAWTRSGAGLGFGLGAGFALLGFIFGVMVGNSNTALAKLGAQIQGKPTEEQTVQINVLRKRLALFSSLNAYSLLIAALLMAISRYVHF
jgi:uncharacterized membrane protein